MRPIPGLWLLALCAAGSAFGYLVLEPMIRAARVWKRSGRPMQFQTSDVLWLAILLHLPSVCLAMAWQRNPDKRLAIGGIGFLLLGVVFYLWFRGVMTLSKVGIHQPLRRGAFLVVAIPVAVLGSMLSAVTIDAALTALFQGYWIAGGSWWLGLTLVLLLACCGARQLTRWLVTGAMVDAPATSDSQPSDEP